MIPRYEIPDNGGTVEVVAGEYEGIKGIARTFSPMNIYSIRMNESAYLNMSLPTDYNTGILVIEGNVRVNEQDDAPADHFTICSATFLGFINIGYFSPFNKSVATNPGLISVNEIFNFSIRDNWDKASMYVFWKRLVAE